MELNKFASKFNRRDLAESYRNRCFKIHLIVEIEGAFWVMLPRFSAQFDRAGYNVF